MKNYRIKEIMAKSYLESLLKENDFDMIESAKKYKIDVNIIDTLFPYDKERNQYELLKIFYNDIGENVLTKFYNEIIDEDISFYEKILEAFFILFELLYKYKKGLIYLSTSFNKKFRNLIVLNNLNHEFMFKLLKICGDQDNFFKLNLKALILNVIYLKNLNFFLSSKDTTLETIMKNLDRDLKNTFNSNFLFNNT